VARATEHGELTVGQRERHLVAPLGWGHAVAAAHQHERRLLHLRQTVFDAVLERRLKLLQEPARACAQVFVDADGERYRRLAPKEILRHAPRLLLQRALLGVDRGGEEHDRADQLGVRRGKLAHDLRAHRVTDGDEGADPTLCSCCQHRSRNQFCGIGDAQRSLGLGRIAEAGQIDRDDLSVRQHRIDETNESEMPHADAVHKQERGLAGVLPAKAAQFVATLRVGPALGVGKPAQTVACRSRLLHHEDECTGDSDLIRGPEAGEQARLLIAGRAAPSHTMKRRPGAARYPAKKGISRRPHP